MSASLESLVPQEEPVVVEETEEAPAPEPPAPETIVEEAPEEANTPDPAVEEVTAAAAPAPKKRGRPRKDAAAKAKAPAPNKAVRMKPPQPQPLTPESSDDDEPIDRDDMETLLLDYLIKRKQTQQDARRNMWAQLVGLR